MLPWFSTAWRTVATSPAGTVRTSGCGRPDAPLKKLKHALPSFAFRAVAVFLDQTDVENRRLAHECRPAGEVIEGKFRVGVEYLAALQRAV